MMTLLLCRNTYCGQVLVLPSRRLVRPVADGDFVIVMDAMWKQGISFKSTALATYSIKLS